MATALQILLYKFLILPLQAKIIIWCYKLEDVQLV